MRRYVDMEVAFEILTMKIAISIKNENKEEMTRLIQERDMLYDGDLEILNKVYEQYANEVKCKIRGEKR